MASGGITGEPVQTARLGSYMSSTGGGKGSNRVTQRTTSSGGSSTQTKTQTNIDRGNASRELNNLVNKSRADSNYRNRSNVYTVGEILDKSNPLNLSKREKDFILRAGLRKDGTLNSAGAARIANKVGGVSRDGAFIGDDRTAYQRDLNNFRKASPINNQAYIDRFPKTAAFESMLNKTAEGIVGMPGRVIKKVTDTYLDGVKNMVEKISGVDAKNIDIAKNKDTDINTIVNNLQRNIKKERDDGKARGMTEADLTAMYGEPIDIETGDDIFGGDLLGMEMLEDDSPLRAQDVAPDAVPLSDIVGGSSEINQRRDELSRGKDVAPGFPKDDDAPGLDLTAPDDSIDLSGTSGRLIDPKEVDTAQEFEEVYGFDSPAYQAAIDRENAEIQQRIDKGGEPYDFDKSKPGNQGYLESVRDRNEGERLADVFAYDVRNQGRDIRDRILSDRNTLGGSSFRKEYPVIADRTGSLLGYADPDEFQDPVTLGPGTVPSFTEAPFEYFPLFEGPLDFDFSPEPRREPEVFNTRADGGQIFGNQNMSTFDKLKAIADGIADNK